MALNSRLESRVYLKWVTERPYAGGSRLSPDFSILQNEWYLELKLTKILNSTSCSYYYEIWLHRRPSPSPSNFLLAVDSELKVWNSSYFKSEYLRNNTQSTCILREQTFESYIKSSGNREEWEVICTFKDTKDCKSFSLQVGNKTIYLSTVKEGDSAPKSMDRCVQVSPEIPRDIDSLSSDFSSLLEDGIFPDFELKCGGRSFPVHRSVLSARSEVFRAMFRSRMLESETGSADIKDLEVPVLESLLKFIYCGKLEQVSEDTISKTYEAADKYAVHCLKMACSYWMKRNLVEENCVSFLDIANSHSDHDLRATVVSFLIQHPRLLKSTAWLTFSKQHQELANEVLQTYVSSTVQ